MTSPSTSLPSSLIFSFGAAIGWAGLYSLQQLSSSKRSLVSSLSSLSFSEEEEGSPSSVMESRENNTLKGTSTNTGQGGHSDNDDKEDKVRGDGVKTNSAEEDKDICRNFTHQTQLETTVEEYSSVELQPTDGTNNYYDSLCICITTKDGSSKPEGGSHSDHADDRNIDGTRGVIMSVKAEDDRGSDSEDSKNGIESTKDAIARGQVSQQEYDVNEDASANKTDFIVPAECEQDKDAVPAECELDKDDDASGITTTKDASGITTTTLHVADDSGDGKTTDFIVPTEGEPKKDNNDTSDIAIATLHAADNNGNEKTTGPIVLAEGEPNKADDASEITTATVHAADDNDGENTTSIIPIEGEPNKDDDTSGITTATVHAADSDDDDEDDCGDDKKTEAAQDTSPGGDLHVRDSTSDGIDDDLDHNGCREKRSNVVIKMGKMGVAVLVTAIAMIVLAATPFGHMTKELSVFATTTKKYAAWSATDSASAALALETVTTTTAGEISDFSFYPVEYPFDE